MPFASTVVLTASTLLVGLGLSSVVYCQSQSPLNNGELNIIQVETPWHTVTVSPEIDTPGPYGSYCSQYPQDNTLSGGSLSTSPFTYWHKDRDHHCPSSLNGDSIGYGLYTVQVDGRTLYVDWRDADYHDMQNYIGSQDIWIYYKHSTHKFYNDQNCTIELPGTVHIWDYPRKNSPPRVHLVVRNSFYGGTVYINGSSYLAPSHQMWTTGSGYQVYAPSQQPYMGTTYYFVSWSDGGAQTHTVAPTLATWNSTLTANYTRNPPIPPPGTPPSDPNAESQSQPNAVQYVKDASSPTIDAFPNPFNPSTAIRYWLPVAAYVELTIYNSLGEVAAALVAGQQQAGEYSVQFDGSNLASGTYFCRLNALGNIETRRVVLMK
jgi:hypothetical protein